MLEGEFTHRIHGLHEGIAGRECVGVARRDEHLGGRELAVEAGQVGAGRFRHGLLGLLARSIVFEHDLQRLVPSAGQGFAEFGIGFERIGIEHHQIDDLSRDFAGVEHQLRVRHLEDFAQLRFPCDHRGGPRRRVRAHDIGIGSVDRLDIALLQSRTGECPGQQIVRHGKFDQVDRLALDVGELFAFAF